MDGIMSNITISGDTSGSVILQANATAGSTTVYLPTTNGTIVTSDASGNVSVTTSLSVGSLTVSVNAITGSSNNQAGVFGQSNSSYGVYALSNSSYGIFGTSNTGIGSSGTSNNSYGVVGTSNTSVGVLGQSTGGYGAYGLSTTNYGLFGVSNTGGGIYGQSNTSTGLTIVSNTGTVATFSNATSTFATIPATGGLGLSLNNTKLTFTPLAGGANVYFIQQNDDNFVLYSTNTSNQPRSIWSIFGNNNGSSFNISVPTNISSGNLTVSSNTLTLGTSSITANGYTRLPNGLLMQWGTQAAANTSSGNVTFPVAFTTAVYSVNITGTQTFTGLLGGTGTAGVNTTVIQVRTTNTGAGVTAYWMAIGV
jgi:hypothetical protein